MLKPKMKFSISASSTMMLLTGAIIIIRVP
jgi:hypothetical protein